ncbi:TRM11 family SAM-dependent methyltransferase [Domibacillus epiphyticus]|uniref:RNA methyltransferase n=1 Tax=Domibacillus epiphyticus TaxID=1714355 RepID=A0A1V2A7P4_9BACI|nr:RNA methyltransferase [Domibacillus epiphyticus]OMP67018.1 RNA methyltransferase [Domibacillus epiphyticus]
MDQYKEISEFVYTYICSEEERSLCRLEMRSLFGGESCSNIFRSSVKIDPSRSPFIKERIDVMFEGDDIRDILKQVEQLRLMDGTFKVLFVKINDLDKSKKIEYQERLKIEREIGSRIRGKADIHRPDFLFGIGTVDGRWFFGPYHKNEAIWFLHMKKPREYSTALSTRAARAIVNIAVPNPEGVKVIDPCCGIGTVLVEALSMGIDIVGRDINPIVAAGSRENIAHFGLVGDVTLGPISEVIEKYDTAIIDLPYNHCLRATPEDQLSILKHARRFAKKVVVVTVKTIDHMIEEAGFEVIDRCEAKKGLAGTFSRQIIVCV